MPRSNSPLALSVVAATQIGDVPATSQCILEFDGIKFGFSHEQTWRSMTPALKGIITPKAAKRGFVTEHPRVRESIVTLCEIGCSDPKETHAFANYPRAGIKEVQGLRISDDCIIRAKASCWYVENDTPVIPILQPRKSEFPLEKRAIYLALAKKAFCRGDWSNGKVRLIDLAGDSGSYFLADETELPHISDESLNEFIATYLEGVALANEQREQQPERYKTRGKKPPESPLFDFYS